MRFQQHEPQRRPAISAGMRKQLMFQVVILILALGLLLGLKYYSDNPEPTVLTPEVDPRAIPAPQRPAGDREAEVATQGDDTDEDTDEDTDAADDDGSSDDPALSLDDLDLDDLDTLEPDLPVEPGPFAERPELAAEAAVLEAKGEVASGWIAHLFHRARTVGPPATTEPALSTLRGDDVFARLTENPQRWRGKLVEIRGNIVVRQGEPAIVLESEIELPTRDPSGVPFAYRAFVHDENRKIFFLSPWRRDREFESLDGVAFRGYFAQLYSYDVNFEGETLRARIPLLVGESLVYVPNPTAPAADLTPFFVVAAVLPLIAGAVILIVSWRSRLAQRARREARLATRRSSSGRSS